MERRLEGGLGDTTTVDIAAALRESTLEVLDDGSIRMGLSAASASDALRLTRTWAMELVMLIAETYPDRTGEAGDDGPRVVSLPDQALRVDVRAVPKVVTAAVLGFLAGVIVILSYRGAEPPP